MAKCWKCDRCGAIMGEKQIKYGVMAGKTDYDNEFQRGGTFSERPDMFDLCEGCWLTVTEVLKPFYTKDLTT